MYDIVKDWQVDHIETVTKYPDSELMIELKKRLTYYIDLYDSINNGYNTCHGGTRNKDPFESYLQGHLQSDKFYHRTKYPNLIFSKCYQLFLFLVLLLVTMRSISSSFFRNRMSEE